MTAGWQITGIDSKDHISQTWAWESNSSFQLHYTLKGKMRARNPEYARHPEHESYEDFCRRTEKVEPLSEQTRLPQASWDKTIALAPETRNTKKKAQDDMKLKAVSRPVKKPTSRAGRVTKEKKQDKLPIKENLKNNKSRKIQTAKGSKVDERSNKGENVNTRKRRTKNA